MSGTFFSRWSRLKRTGETSQQATPPEQRPAPNVDVPDGAAAVPAPTQSQTPLATPVASAEQSSTAKQSTEELPSLENLTPDSDFSPFMRKEVDQDTRRAALKTLFKDPRFNVQDGLDVYIDDYSKPDPMPVEWLAKLASAKFLNDQHEARVAEERAALRDEGQKQAQIADEGPVSQAEPARIEAAVDVDTVGVEAHTQRQLATQSGEERPLESEGPDTAHARPSER